MADRYSSRNNSRRDGGARRSSGYGREGSTRNSYSEDPRSSGAGVNDFLERFSGNSGNGSGRPSRGSAQTMDRGVANGRMGILLVVFIAALLVLFCRLVWLQVIDAENISESGTSREVTITVDARRGTIYDRNGTILATTVDAYNMFCHPHVVSDDDADRLANTLATVFGGEASTYLEKINSDSNFAYLYKGADADQMQQIVDLGIEGVDYEETSKRVYPCGATASQIIGVLNSDGEAITGLELYYDDILGGTDGEKTLEYSKEGVPVPDSETVTAEVVNGQDIVLSIDVGMQQQLEEALAVRVEAVQGTGGSAVLMDAETGEIYACSSSPTFNITDLSEVAEGATNLACISAAFEPGSIMKPVTMLAALESGTVTINSSYDVPASLTVGDDTITDSHERSAETMSVSTIMAESSNIGMSLIARDMTFSVFYEYLQKYKIAETTGVDYPGEVSGSLTSYENWSTVQGYNISFGQGLTTTPISMVRFYGMLANDGVATTPHFLLDVPTSSEDTTYETSTVTENVSAIDSLETMMEAVVNEGTATDAQIDGYRVVGKTGTAEIASSSGGYQSGVYNISFIGYLPDSSTNLVCFVGATEVPGDRKTVSAFKDIMSYAIERYNITQD